MDKNAIKKYAVWARTELITRVSQRAEKYDITAEADASASSVNGVLLSDAEIKQRKALIEQVKQKGFDQVMEEVAYTWFNRFIALRFMEVNGYLPSHIRVFTDDNNNFKPQILAEAIHLELDDLDMEKVYEMKNNNENDELYKYLIITQCNELSKILPGMFQKIADYTELLFPANVLREGSVIEQMVAQIEEKDWDVSGGGQIEILGWLYQFYISEKHEAVVDPLHGKIINKDEVPAATALFTTDWVVRYIIDNSVGRYWIERNPGSNLKNELEYFIIPKDGKLQTVEEKIVPEDITVLDPSMGSAHFGVYAFDVLMKIYMEYGVSEREAASSIVENNLFGLDIDDRSAQIAYFAIMMKARQYDRRFFTRGIQPHFYSIQESNSVDRNAVEYFAAGNENLRKGIESILNDFEDGKEYGSILQVRPVDFEAIFERLGEIEKDINIYKDIVLKQIKPIIQVAKVMSDKYVIVATNPPYMNKYDDKLKFYINNHYKDYSGDLFSVFMYHNFDYCKNDGYSGFMTPNTWMAAKQYEKLRDYIYNHKAISTFIQMAKGAFFKEATVDICAYVFKNGSSDEAGTYIRLDEFHGDMDVQKAKVLEALSNCNCDYVFSANDRDFESIPGKPIAYWISDNGLKAFNYGLIGDYAETKQGFKTGNNDKFLKLWFEVSSDKLFLGEDKEEKKWFPCNKGGNFRKWYGNKEYVVDWENDGYELINYKDKKGKQLSRPQNLSYNFKTGLTWSTLSSGPISFRYSNQDMMFESKGSECFIKDDCLSIWKVQGYLNSIVCMYFLGALAPTVDYSEGSILKLPFIKFDNDEVDRIVKRNVELSKEDWDSFELSWDFRLHPLSKGKSIEEAFQTWSEECNQRFNEMKENEEKLNKFYINLFNLDNDLDYRVTDKDITVNKADKNRDVRSFVSYAVGCMFGRYSLDRSGVIYAGGTWNPEEYKSYQVDRDAIIPICDDEYFNDDITGLFVQFVEIVYGKDMLEQNLQFIADALGGKGSSREVIRNYFLNDFYADHLKTYQKRPIYWLFDSGKKNGFKCLIYAHRYQADTIARIRTNYVHEQQARYRTAIEEIENRLLSVSGSDKVKLEKKLRHLKEQDDEIHTYEEKIHHLADQMIAIDLDEGVKNNYAKFQDVLAKIK